LTLQTGSVDCAADFPPRADYRLGRIRSLDESVGTDYVQAADRRCLRSVQLSVL